MQVIEKKKNGMWNKEEERAGPVMKCEDDNTLFPSIVSTLCLKSKNEYECPVEYIPQGSECVRKPFVHNVLPCFSTGTSNIVFVHRSRFDSHVFHTSLQRFINSSSPAALSEDYTIDKVQTQLTGNASRNFLHRIDLSFSLPKKILENTDRIYIALNSLGNITIGLTNWSKQNFFAGEGLCEKVFLLDINSINISSNCDAVAGNKTIPFSNLSFLVIIENDTARLYIKECHKLIPKTSCIQQEFVPPYLFQRMLDIGYKLCAKKSSLVSFMQHILDRICGYISFWGTLISILFSSLSLISFFVFPDTMPFGLFCLCVSILVSDILYVTVIGLHSTEQQIDRDLCYGLAVSLHIIGIVVQCCSVVSAVDIAKTFGVVFSSKRILIVISLPVVVVVLAVTFDYLDVVDMGYGEDGICLFTGYRGWLLFYVIPNSLCIVCTSVFVVYTLHQVIKHNREGEQTSRGAGTTRPVSVAQVRVYFLNVYSILKILLISMQSVSTL